MLVRFNVNHEESVLYSGVLSFDIDTTHKRIRLVLNHGYQCKPDFSDEDEFLRRNNTSCAPYVHIIYNVDSINAHHC